MDEIKLRYFISVAKRKNFALAAMDQHVVPSTMSRQIAALEEEFGTPLFTRTTHRVELTEAGARLFEQATSYLVQYEKINANVRNLLPEKYNMLINTLLTCTKMVGKRL